jgi:DNA-binding transcriptional MerR regulator
MTGALLDLAELAARAEVPVDRLRHFAEVGLLPPAGRDGDRFGYPASEAHIMRLLDTAQHLGIAADDLPALTRSWRDGDCGRAQQRLADAVTARLDRVQDQIAEQQQLAVQRGPGTSGWADATRLSVPLAEDAARLQAVTAALRATTHAGPCDGDCGCMAAMTAPGNRYQFPTAAATGESALACDLAADDGDAAGRIGIWQQVLTRVQRRDPLTDTPNGLALRFPLEAELAATLARLAAAEFRCCSFGSYTIVVDHTGLRLEIRMPDDATGMLAAVVGVPDPPAAQPKEAVGTSGPASDGGRATPKAD